jgi:Tol biopolymer transport system component
VRTAAAAGSLIVALAMAVLFTPAAFAASGLIAYSDTNGSLYVASTQGANARTLFQSTPDTSMEAVAMSPDGKQVIAIEYTDDQQLALIPVAGGAPVLVPGTLGADFGSFSPDGGQILFSVNQDSSSTLQPGIYTVGLSGGTPKAIVSSPTGAYDSLAEYSPDGSKVAFVRDLVDSRRTETQTLEIVPAGGGSPTALATGVLSDNTSGGRLSFSPDGSTIAYAGDYANTGIFTIPAAGGQPTALTTDDDYWPSFSGDGSKVLFARDAGSDNADDNADQPVAPSNGDLDELWSIKKDGTGAAVLAEGDYEDLTLAPAPPPAGSSPAGSPGNNPAGSSSGGGSSSPGSSSSNSSSSPSTTSSGSSSGKSSTTKSTTVTHVVSARSISVKHTGSHYLVKWAGTAHSWKVILKVGRKTKTATVKGSLHSHTFIWTGAKGAVSAQVRAA